MNQFQHPGAYEQPPAKKGLSTGAIVGIIIGAVVLLMVPCLALLAGVMLPALGKARQSARMIKSSAQLRGIGQGLMLYAMNNQDSIPEAGADLSVRLREFVDPTMFDAPEATSGMISYYYVPIGKMNMTGTSTTGPAVILYENPNLAGRRMFNVAYADGSVQVYGVQEFEQIIGNITLPDGTRWAPHRDTSQPAGSPAKK